MPECCPTSQIYIIYIEREREKERKEGEREREGGKETESRNRVYRASKNEIFSEKGVRQFSNVASMDHATLMKTC